MTDLIIKSSQDYIIHKWFFFVKRNFGSMQRMTLKGAGFSWPFLDCIGFREIKSPYKDIVKKSNIKAKMYRDFHY